MDRGAFLRRRIRDSGKTRALVQTGEYKQLLEQTLHVTTTH